ncbi:radical SAM protein [Methylomonas sp. MK1]|uniref:radical SAM protein n=1 Tax=Methylomonas sp. MK1 TaxID=1131552 RepID=UPI001360B544|nr:radical SAM protein [Methylomonas sp. MK1]
MEDFRKIRGVPVRPNLHMEVSLGCNISCEMCTFHDNLKKFSYMSLESLKKINGGFDYFGAVHMGDGSEPFINPDLIDIIKYLSEKGVFVSVQTNAKLIRNESDAEKIVKSGLNMLLISVDAVYDETLHKIRDGMSFSHIARVIDLVNEAKHKLNSKTPYLGSNAVVMRRNLNEIPLLVTHLLDNEFSFIRLGFLELRKPNNSLAGELLIYEMGKALEIINKTRSQVEVHRNSVVFDTDIFNGGMSSIRRGQCSAYRDRVYVTHIGDMWACYGKQRIGNIFESSIDQLINSATYKEYIEKVTTPGNPICSACTFCHIMSMDNIGDHFGRNAINHYGIELIEKSLEFAAAGGEPREFWAKQSLA